MATKNQQVDIVVDQYGNQQVIDDDNAPPDPFASLRAAVKMRLDARVIGKAGKQPCRSCSKEFTRRKDMPFSICDDCNLSNGDRLAHSVTALIRQIEDLQCKVQAPGVERIYELGKLYIALVPVLQGTGRQTEIIGWALAEHTSVAIGGVPGGKRPALFKQYPDARAAADEYAKRTSRPEFAGRVYEIPIGDLADSDWTEVELYQHVERMMMQFTAEEVRLRPVISGTDAKPAGSRPDNLLTFAGMAAAGPRQISNDGQRQKIACRRCNGVFEMPSQTFTNADPKEADAMRRRGETPPPAERINVPGATFCAMCSPIVMHALAHAVIQTDRMMRDLSEMPDAPPPETPPEQPATDAGKAPT